MSEPERRNLVKTGAICATHYVGPLALGPAAAFGIALAAYAIPRLLVPGKRRRARRGMEASEERQAGERVEPGTTRYSADEGGVETGDAYGEELTDLQDLELQQAVDELDDTEQGLDGQPISDW